MIKMSLDNEELYWEDYFLRLEWEEGRDKGYTNMDFKCWKNYRKGNWCFF